MTMSGMCEMTQAPDLWQKPAYEHLLAFLMGLEVRPLVWGVNVSTPADIMHHESLRVQDRREISRFLSSVISSNLTWIEDEDRREEIWNVASRRLAERCGRTAMGEITREFPFLRENGSTFYLKIREPPITGDSLGLKTWGSSYVLAKLLPRIAEEYLPHMDLRGKRVLELGSGTGLLGLAAACLWGSHVTLTDLPAIMPNLVYNVESNRGTAAVVGGMVDTGLLTWGNRDETDTRFHGHQYELVIAADPLYDDDHPTLLAGAIHEQLALTQSARAVVMVPYRDEATRKLARMLREELLRRNPPLGCIDERMVTGQDDWGDEGEGEHVECWLGIFRRQ